MSTQTQIKTSPFNSPARSLSIDSEYNYFTPLSTVQNAVFTHTHKFGSDNVEDALLQNIVNFYDPNSELVEKVLLDLLDHVFMKVLPNVSESCKKCILLEIWNLISREVILHLPPTLDRWSKAGLFSAIKIMEQNSDGFCSIVLASLVNFKIKPFMIDIAIHFLEENYQDDLHVSKAANRILQTNQQTTVQCSSTQRIRRHTTTSVTTYRNPHEFDFQHHMPSKNFFSKRLILVLVLVTFVTTVSCLGTSLLLYQKLNRPEPNPTSTEITLMAFTGTKSVVPGIKMVSSASSTKRPEILTRHSLTVGSYEEYKNELFRLVYERELNLVMHLEKDENWPTGFTMGNTHMIKELKIVVGSSIRALFHILRAMYSVENVTITNVNDKICKSLEQYNNFFHENIILSSVKQFVIEDFDECYEFQKTISETLVLNKLHAFEASNCTFTKQNTQFIRKLILNSRGSLKSLEFPGCKLNASLFDNVLTSYLDVKYLKIDFGNSVTQLHKNIYSVFPNLETFVSNNGFVELSQFLNFSGCRFLQHVKIGLKTSYNNLSIDLRPLLKFFRRLKYLDLSLYFVGMNLKSGCHAVGMQQLNRSLNGDFVYRSNCFLDTDILNK